MMLRPKFLAACVALTLLPGTACAQEDPAAQAINPQDEYIAVLSAFPPELAAIEAVMISDKTPNQTFRIAGREFRTAEINGRHFVFFLTGMSLVNAALTTQMALDRFHVRAVFFTGIAGGVDPGLHAGDVVIPARWHYHSEAFYFNETAPGKFTLAPFYHGTHKNFGMIFPESVTVIRDGMKDWAQVPFFEADPALLAAAERATATLPPMRLGERVCKVQYGGDGVAGTVFCDNAEYRKWVFDEWKAVCLDMESTAVAQVCWENKKPFLVVRGLSDLAGGQAGENQMEANLKAAADNSAAVLTRILQNLDPLPGAAPVASPSPAGR